MADGSWARKERVDEEEMPTPDEHERLLAMLDLEADIEAYEAFQRERDLEAEFDRCEASHGRWGNAP